MIRNLTPSILLDVSSEHKTDSCFRQNFFLFLFLLLILDTPVGAGETDFKTFRKTAQQEISLQKEIINQDPLDFLSYFELGLACLKLGRHEEEVKAYQEALALNPESAKTHYNLAMAYDYLKQGSKAVYHMRKAQDLYVTQRNHRKIRATQRQLKRLYFSYPEQLRALNSADRPEQ